MSQKWRSFLIQFGLAAIVKQASEPKMMYCFIQFGLAPIFKQSVPQHPPSDGCAARRCAAGAASCGARAQEPSAFEGEGRQKRSGEVGEDRLWWYWCWAVGVGWFPALLVLVMMYHVWRVILVYCSEDPHGRRPCSEGSLRHGLPVVPPRGAHGSSDKG